MTTRAVLLDDLNLWMRRDDLRGVTATSILRLAQNTIDRQLRIREQEKETALVVTDRTILLPDDYLALRSLTMTDAPDRRITFLTPELIRELGTWDGRRSAYEDAPSQAYSIEGSRLIIAPAGTPETPVTLTMVYYAKVPPLVEDDDTNAILRQHYDLYLWAVCKSAATWLEDMEREASFEAKFQIAVKEINEDETFARISGSALRATGSPRRIV